MYEGEVLVWFGVVNGDLSPTAPRNFMLGLRREGEEALTEEEVSIEDRDRFLASQSAQPLRSLAAVWL